MMNALLDGVGVGEASITGARGWSSAATRAVEEGPWRFGSSGGVCGMG